jgi:two-component system cell cycle sensor histidine kinase/response regulator CckA
LQQALKMESIGRLAGGVAHDFNNMLQVILGYTNMALNEIDPETALHNDLTESRKAANRAADLTRQLLAFARKQTMTPKVLDLNETVSGMLMMLRRLIGENIDLTWQPTAADTTVKMDPAQIDQILANLCVNARDAIAGVGKLKVETSTLTADANFCAKNTDLVPGEYVTISVSDTGCGMDPETIKHIFEPFYTTKEVGEGTGLGLATVYGIVMQNKGCINLTSIPEKGTTFRLCLPRHFGEAVQLPTSDSAKAALRGHETILLVEDEASILKLGKQMLEGLGYRVLKAGLPNEAIAVAEKYTEEISLLLTDVVMPQMNGLDLATHLTLLHPEIKHMFMSGYTADIIIKQGLIEKGVHFIQKPFTIQDLAVKVREILD